VSLTSAFVINYVGSLFNLVVLLLGPAMVSLCLALAAARGPQELLLLPLLAAFVLMVTAVFYQFRGWLAALMVNKRRRRTIIVTLTALVILLAQAPQLINVMRPWSNKGHRGVAGTPGGPGAQNISPEESKKRAAQEQQRQWERIGEIATIANLCVPPGWLPLGAGAVAEGKLHWTLACTLGMALLGTASLWRAYRTTVRMYTGQVGQDKKPILTAPAPTKAPAPTPVAPPLLEKQLRWVPEQASAVALASFQSLLRAPEAKLALMSSLMMMGIFGALAVTRAGDMPERMRPLLPFGCMGMVLLSTVQFIGNQFGFDRSGFRVFVLSPTPRDQILLGKNLGFAPFALGLGLLLTLVIQFVVPMRPDWFLAVLLQQVAMYVLFCLLGNVLSILAPLRIAAGSMKPVSMNFLTTLLYILFTLFFPVILAPTLLPFGAELALDWLGWRSVPVYLILSLVEAALILLAYRLLLPVLGELLQAREQKILEIVTTKTE